MSIKRKNISVIVRARPILPEERQKRHNNRLIGYDENKKQILQILRRVNSQPPKQYTFDQILSEECGQADVFQKGNIQKYIQNVLSGYNATIFAYGQTGSGKTYTMEGYLYDRQLKPIITVSFMQENTTLLGVVPRSIRLLFEQIRRLEASTDFRVSCSFLQIYKERVYDLLNPAQFVGNNAPGLKVRWNQAKEFYAENLTSFTCTSFQEVLNHYNVGARNKIMASHNLNFQSSRSHCIFTINLDIIQKTQNAKILNSRLNLVDLAGSERSQLTGNQGENLKEAIEINKSLFTLRQVITNLASQDAKGFVPYRDSKLTSLLKQSLGGNSYCLMIACIAPIDSFIDENISTLSYAAKAQSICNEPMRNIDPKSKVMKGLQKELKNTQGELHKAQNQIKILIEMLELKENDQKSWSNKLGALQQSEMKPKFLNQLNKIRLHPRTPQQGKSQFAEKTQYANSMSNTQASFMQHNPSIVKNENGDFQFLTTELLSDKLHDSVVMIKDLLDTNKKLKDTIYQLSNARRNFELEKSQLIQENEMLRDQLENQDDRGIQLSNLELTQRQVEQLTPTSRKPYSGRYPTPSNKIVQPPKKLQPLNQSFQQGINEEQMEAKKEDALDALQKMIINRVTHSKKKRRRG